MKDHTMRTCCDRPGIVLLVVAFSIGTLSSCGGPRREAKPGALGAVEVVSGPTACEEAECYELSVSCPEVEVPARARLKINSASGDITRGTILFPATGVGTGQFYEAYGGAIVDATRSAGFQSVQLLWTDAWLAASEGEKAGHVRLACRPATIARWVYEHIHERGDDTAFCATGHSGGAMQVSYMLTHYGLEDILAAVVPTGGPPTGRIDRGCLRNDPENAEVRYLSDYSLSVMDAGFGFPPEGDPTRDASYGRPGNGPCARGDAAFEDEWRAASVASGEGDYVYPQTMVWFVQEGIDEYHAAAQGLLYYDLLLERGSPLVRKDIIADVDHFGEDGLFTSEEATALISNILVGECRRRN